MTDAELVSELRANVERSHPAWSMAPTVLAAAEAIERLTAQLTLAQGGETSRDHGGSPCLARRSGSGRISVEGRRLPPINW